MRSEIVGLARIDVKGEILWDAATIPHQEPARNPAFT